MAITANHLQKSLTSLLPGLNPLPPRLLAATESLISLSRQRAHNLKPDEEIARAHACAELACKKLRVSLRLPNVVKSGAGAPCRPVVYKKLLTFLENTLADVDVVGTPSGRNAVKTPTRTPTTGKRKRDVELERNVEQEQGEEVETPSKKQKVQKTPTTATNSSAQQKKKNMFLGRIDQSSRKASSDEAPDYVLPTVRKMCRTFKTPAMVAHVYTGVCVVLPLGGLWPRQPQQDEEEEEAKFREEVLGATVAIYLLTLTRMQVGLMTTDLYQTVLGRSIEILELKNREQDVTEVIEEWIAKIQERAWTTEVAKGAGWWDSVPENVLQPLRFDENGKMLVNDDGEDENDQDVQRDDGSPTPRTNRRRNNQMNSWEARRDELRRQLDEDDPEDVLLPGLGTMMNDAVDYFNEERIAEYEHWKAGLLKRIAAAEKGWTQNRKGRTVAVQ